MSHFDKHSQSIKALVDVSEAILNAMESHGIDPETVANRKEFTIFIHFLKSIIDSELGIPNEIADAIKNKSNELGLDINDIDKRLH